MSLGRLRLEKSIAEILQRLIFCPYSAGRKFTPDLVEKDRQNILHEHKDGRPGAPRGEIDETSAPQPGFGAENDTHSGVSYPDSIGRPVGRASEDQTAMRHV